MVWEGRRREASPYPDLTSIQVVRMCKQAVFQLRPLKNGCCRGTVLSTLALAAPLASPLYREQKLAGLPLKSRC